MSEFKCSMRVRIETTATLSVNPIAEYVADTDTVTFDWPAIERETESAYQYARGRAKILLAARAAGREEAAQVVDQCNLEGPYNAIGAASRIRALSLDHSP